VVFRHEHDEGRKNAPGFKYDRTAITWISGEFAGHYRHSRNSRAATERPIS
jgi:hypothetical protein